MDGEMTLRGTDKPQLGDRDWRVVGGLPHDATVSVRYGWDPSTERVVTREIVIQPATSEGRVSSEQLQRIPVAALERLVNAAQEYMDLKMQTSDLPRLRRTPDDTAESFADRVAEQYKLFAGLTRSPAKEMALREGVPVSRVHRWIREARKLGKLPPGRQGTAG